MEAETLYHQAKSSYWVDATWTIKSITRELQRETKKQKKLGLVMRHTSKVVGMPENRDFG